MIIVLVIKEEAVKRSVDWIYNQLSEGKKEVLEEMTVDCWSISLIEGKKEVLEEKSIHYYYNEGFEERKEVLEGRSIGYNHIVTESTHQEEEEALLTPILQDSAFRRHSFEYVVMRCSWLARYIHYSFLRALNGLWPCRGIGLWPYAAFTCPPHHIPFPAASPPV